MNKSTTLAIMLSAGLTLVSGGAFALDRDAQRIEKFDKLDGTGSTAQLLQTPIGLGRALGSFAAVTRAFDQSGNGDVHYWMKTARDYGNSAQALGQALSLLGSSMPSGPVAAAVAGMGGQLSGISSGGNGDAHYWMARVKSICTTVRAVGQQMETMAASCTNGPSVPAGAVLRGLSIVAASVNYGGNGTADYWMRTTKNFCLIGRGVGRAVDSVAAVVPAPLDGVLHGMAAQLTGLSEAGNGTADYWMARARGVAEQMRGVAESLRQIASSL